MPVFVVSLRLPDSFSDEFLGLIPEHRAFINNLLSEHVIESYAIGADRGRGWVFINAEDEEAARSIVAQFPLYPHLQVASVDRLFIFDTVASQFPQISLN